MDSLRITLVGEGGVGKSALIVRFITGRFLHHYDPTLEDEYKATLRGLCNLTIKDTAGQECNHLDYYCKSSDVFLVAFSVADFSSLQRAKELIGMISNYGIAAILVGTKSDLLTQRQVLSEEALSTANQMGVHYIETSAAMELNVEQVFKLAASLATASKKSVRFQSDSAYPEFKKHQSSIKGLLKKWKPFKNDKKLLKSLA